MILINFKLTINSILVSHNKRVFFLITLSTQKSVFYVYSKSTLTTPSLLLAESWVAGGHVLGQRRSGTQL